METGFIATLILTALINTFYYHNFINQINKIRKSEIYKTTLKYWWIDKYIFHKHNKTESEHKNIKMHLN